LSLFSNEFGEQTAGVRRCCRVAPQPGRWAMK
jgi:hypothetical protein